MTEGEESRTPPWVPVLAAISRASGHELRNALNALVVNLEVVRTKVDDPAIQPFVAQSVAQTEESVRLAESAIALLDLVIGAIGPNGEVQCELSSARSVRIKPTSAELERVTLALRSLTQRGAIDVDTSDSTVILSIPDKHASPIRE